MTDNIIRRLKKDFKPETGSIKDAVKLKAPEVTLSDDIVQFVSNLRRNGKVIVVIPYKNDLKDAGPDKLANIFSKGLNLKDETNLTFNMFSADIDVTISGRIDTYIVDVTRMTPVGTTIDDTAKDFFSRNAMGYFAIIDDKDLTDKELTLYVMFIKHTLEKRCSLKSIAMSAQIDEKIDSTIPYRINIRKL